MTKQLTYVNGSDAFTFFGSAFQRCSESNDRDLFSLDIPFQRDPFVMDFVDTIGSITISGKLVNASGATDGTAYNSTDGGGCTGQLNQLRALSIPSGDGEQVLLFLSISDWGTLMTNVPVFVQRLSFEVSDAEPVGVISYSVELKRASV